VLYKQFNDTANIHLFIVAEVEKPGGKLVDTFNLPSHNSIMPWKELFLEGYIGAETHIVSPWVRSPVSSLDSGSARHFAQPHYGTTNAPTFFQSISAHIGT
jgi:hypothetical protein